MKNVSLHIADEASDRDTDTVERRGKIAGKLIGTAQIEEDVTHSCVVPDEIEARALYDHIARDFETTTTPLNGNADELDDKRELAATKRVQRQRQDERAAAAAEEAAAKARAKAKK